MLSGMGTCCTARLIVTARWRMAVSVKTKNGAEVTKKEEIQTALRELAKSGMTSKELRKEIEKAFPKASKKEIRLAAFSAMIAIVEQRPQEATELQDLAITTSTTENSTSEND